MSDEKSNAEQPTLDDAGRTTAAPDGGWQMPEPKFQQTSGYLPQGFEKQFGTAAAPAPSSPEPAAEAAPADVEEQPDLSEILTSEPPPMAAPAPVKKERSAALRVTLVVLGLIGMIVFIGAFLAVVYFLFFAPRANGSNF